MFKWQKLGMYKLQTMAWPTLAGQKLLWFRDTPIVKYADLHDSKLLFLKSEY